jgi:hypothetical protein
LDLVFGLAVQDKYRMNLTSLPTFFVHEDKILINKAVLRFIEGNLVLQGSIEVSAPSKFETLSVNDTLTVKTIKAETVQVRNLITDWEFKTDESSTNSLVWNYKLEETLDGKGLTWQYGDNSVHLLYKTGGNLTTNANLVIEEDNSYQIGQDTVLSKNKLGDSIFYSNLRELGKLSSLTVIGESDFQSNVSIKKLNVKEINSVITFNNEVTINGKVTVNGEMTVDSVYADKILDKTGKVIKLDEYKGNVESDLYGKGISWSYADNNYQMVYGNGNRLWSNLNLDLSESNTYRINDIPVLSIDELGPGVIKSNLQKVGILKNLRVSGNASFGEFAFFNGDMFRVGLGTEDPDTALHIHDFGVDILLGSQEQNTASIGVKTYHDLNLITDNTTRILIKNSGEVIFGNPSSKNANVTIFGTLHVDNLISDTRIDKYNPLEFKASGDSNVWGLGIKWKDVNTTASFLLMPNPNRIISSEHLDLAGNKSYHIDGQSVLSENSLGDSVTDSKLTSLGVLKSLEVAGDVVFRGTVASRDMNVEKINLSGSLTADRQIIMKAKGDTVYYADENGISIGNNQNTSRPVKVFGPLSIGISNPDPSVNLSVSGNIILGGKKFISKESAPSEGIFNKGDVCWNVNPAPGNFIGWVCISAGTPGQWAPFGLIT